MAKVRGLKKDIDYLTSFVIEDSYNCLAYGASEAVVEEIINEAFSIRMTLRQRISAGKKIDKSEQAAYYKGIRKEMQVSINDAFSKLSDLVKKN